MSDQLELDLGLEPVVAKKRVLLIVPTFPVGPAVHPRSRESIEAIEIPADVEMDVLWASGDVPGVSHYQNLTDKHNLARARVLDEGYDYLFSVEADMIVPPDCLTKLLAVNAPVVYSLYVGRLNKVWLCFTKLYGSKGESIVADWKKAQAAFGSVIESAGVGMGCTLIHRDVLEKVEFRLGDSKETFADDWYFALDCKKAKIQSFSHLGVVCGHIRRDGSVLWPSIEDPKRWWTVEEAPGPKIDLVQHFEVETLKPLWLALEKRYAVKGERHIMDKLTASRLVLAKAVRIIGEAQLVSPVSEIKENEDGADS